AVKPQTEIEQHGVRRMVVKLPAKLPYLVMGYKVPVLKTVDQEWEAYALEVMAGVLDGGNSARLESGIVRGRQLAVSASAGYSLTSRMEELFTLEATPAQGKTVEEVEQALIAEIDKLKNEPVKPDELKRIKAQVTAEAIYERDSMFYQGMQLGMMETVGLGWQKVDEYVDKVSQVTAEQVRAVANKYFTEDNLSIAYLDPQPIDAQPAQPESKEAK
ncbi:MAG: M16 family metallopeptidase, partial [Gammaproteobacteria bacterium]